jgi:hypothetical protein
MGPGSSHDLEHMLKSNCGILNLPESFDGEDISDCRPALLKFMATATPDSRVASDILDHFSHHKDAMTITPANHFTSSTGEHSIELTVDNVPDTVNPVKAKLAYIQVPSQDGKSTDLHLVWKVRAYFLFTCIIPNFVIVIRSSKSRCKTTGMKLQSPLLPLTRSSLSLTGLQTLLFQFRVSPISQPPIMSSHGVSTIQLVAIDQLPRKTMMFWLHHLVGIHFLIRTIQRPQV